MSELKQLAELVKETRDTQKSYWKAQWQSKEKQELLVKSKEFERKLDKAVDEILSLQQKNLF